MQDDFEKSSKKDFKKRNKYAALLRDQGDFKGAFSIKVVDPRKEEYKRKKLRVTEILDEEDSE